MVRKEISTDDFVKITFEVFKRGVKSMGAHDHLVIINGYADTVEDGMRGLCKWLKDNDNRKKELYEK